MEEKIAAHFKKSRATGSAFGIFDNGKSNFFYHGITAASGSTVSENSVFELGSVTKVFTTAILMDFVDRQIVALDDPIGKFLPFLQTTKFKTKEITLEQLATHYSGLPNIPSNLTPADVKNPYVDYTIQDLYEFLKAYRLQRAPGEQFEYSNLGLGLLGHILCLVSKTNYAQLVTTTIFDKLSMTNTSILGTSNRSAQLCQGYFMQQPIAPWDCTDAFVGAVGIRSTIKDMMQFLVANLKTSPLSDLFKRCHQLRCSATHNESIGLGWLIDHSIDADIIWHDGITAGFQSFIGFNPQQKRGVVALANSSVNWIAPLSFEILTLPALLPSKTHLDIGVK